MSHRTALAPGDVLALELPAAFDDLPAGLVGPIEQWFRAHGVDPRRVYAGRPVERDVERAALTFRELVGEEVRRRIVLPPVDHRTTWPSPFPPEWLALT